MSYLLAYPDLVLGMIADHLVITLSALGIALVIALPLGWFLFYHPRVADWVLGILGVLYTIPSIALMIFLIPLFGLNARVVVAALVIYCQIVLVRNVLTGLKAIDPTVTEAALGMGMNRWQLAWRVQLPLALPVILAGVRIAAVVSLAIASLGPKFGAGGLGTLLFDGVAEQRTDKIALGAALVAVLALIINYGLLAVESRLISRWRVAAQHGT
jgi:osmoprotectant transport system permease protein